MQPAEIEVSHVNWILREQNRSIPHRRAERPPVAIGPEYYGRRHGNTDTTTAHRDSVNGLLGMYVADIKEVEADNLLT